MFEIAWNVDEDQWLAAENTAAQFAPGSPPDRQHAARDDAWLVGEIRFCDGDHAYPPVKVPTREHTRIAGRGYSMVGLIGLQLLAKAKLQATRTAEETEFARGFEFSVFEFADDMASAFGPQDYAYAIQEDGIRFHEALGSAEIRFVNQGPRIGIYSSSSIGWTVKVPTAEFRPGVERFLRSFANAVAERIPALVEWESFQPIMAWR